MHLHWQSTYFDIREWLELLPLTLDVLSRRMKQNYVCTDNKTFIR
jgi:hypothetical protein